MAGSFKRPIVTLASGYVSTGVDVEKGLIYKERNKDTFIDVFLNKSYLGKDSPYDFNSEANELYRILLQNDTSVKNIDIYCRAISLFKTLFCDMGLLEWVDLQRESSRLTASHIDFIRSTLDFITKGKGRVLDTGTYSRLICATENDELSLATVSKQIDLILNENYMIDKNLSNLLVTWISQPGGFTDLISTMYVIYGSRDNLTDYSK